VPGRAEVEAASARLGELVVRTPVIDCPAFDARAGASLLLKCENLQRGGAFKARGAQHAVGRLVPGVRARGIVTYSSGNHAQAVALAARRFGCRADVFMPVDAPAIKREAVERLGARVELVGTTSTERRAAACAFAARTGAAIIEPFDDPDIIAGQGTATLELLEQAGPLDALLVPVGGGGLVAGACLACEGTSTAVYTVEPAGCDAMARSLAAGRRVVVDPGPTLADGLKPSQVGERNFEIARARVAGSFTVTDDELAGAMLALLLDAKLLVEPSGAAALAVALRGELPGSPQRVGVILSGGNVAPERVGGVLAAAHRA
jgi:threonine dehydratase